MKTIEGDHKAAGLRFGIVVSRFNEFVTSRLLAGAVDVLSKSGANEEAIEVVWVPGAFELPLVARRLAHSRRYHAVICLGAVIRGETTHYLHISQAASRGIAEAARDADLPIVFGVLTTESAEQALERAGPPERNKGAEAARTAIEMASLMGKLPALGDSRPGPQKGRSATSGTRARRAK